MLWNIRLRPPVGADLSACAVYFHFRIISLMTIIGAGRDQAAPNVTPPRSEGSVALGRKMLRCTQHDSAVTPMGAQNILLMTIIVPTADSSALSEISPIPSSTCPYISGNENTATAQPAAVQIVNSVVGGG
jgi:hypothetical protein